MLSDEKVFVNDEEVPLSDEHIVLGDERVWLNDGNMSAINEKVWLNDGNMGLSDEKVWVGDEISGAGEAAGLALTPHPSPLIQKRQRRQMGQSRQIRAAEQQSSGSAQHVARR